MNCSQLHVVRIGSFSVREFFMDRLFVTSERQVRSVVLLNTFPSTSLVALTHTHMWCDAQPSHTHGSSMWKRAEKSEYKGISMHSLTHGAKTPFCRFNQRDDGSAHGQEVVWENVLNVHWVQTSCDAERANLIQENRGPSEVPSMTRGSNQLVWLIPEQEMQSSPSYFSRLHSTVYLPSFPFQRQMNFTSGHSSIGNL